ncbi:hypothetical protein G6O67_006210 [Ophiocordyceps sinensis]|uniref:Uncharacterized protein n=1 Tax=Ophiocordyceps sinensis TaxID=72228 RepID=A0A8H4LW95_9HYPO|nr:hypothetical protein G6O67_006210 [Ophiocordyceps sinensis]
MAVHSLDNIKSNQHISRFPLCCAAAPVGNPNTVPMPAQSPARHDTPSRPCRQTPSTPCTAAAASATTALGTKPPVVLAGKLVVQGLNPLRLLALAEAVRGSNLEKRGRRVDEPLGLDARRAVHVLLGREHKSVVNHPLGLLAEQGRAGVQVDGCPLDERLVPLLGILARRIAKEASAQRAPHLLRVAPARHDPVPVPVHDFEQLVAHVFCPLHRARVDEVLKAPRDREAAVLPRVVDVEQREVVAVGVVELCLFLVCLLLLLLGAGEDVEVEQCHDAEYLVRAIVVHGRNEHLCQRRLHGKVGHFAPEARQQPLVVERAQRVQLLERRQHRVDGRRVHKVKVQQVVDAHGLEHEDRVCQVLPLNVRDRRRQHLGLVCRLGVEPEAFARPSAPGPARPLVSLRLRDGCHDERVHAQLGVVGVLLDESRIHDVVNLVNGNGRLSNVGSNHHLAAPGRCRVENAVLHLRRQLRIHGHNDEVGHAWAQGLHALV